MKKELTEHLQKVWDFVESYVKENDELPKVREISEGLGLKKETIAGYLDTLWRRGYNVKRKK